MTRREATEKGGGQTGVERELREGAHDYLYLAVDWQWADLAQVWQLTLGTGEEGSAEEAGELAGRANTPGAGSPGRGEPASSLRAAAAHGRDAIGAARASAEPTDVGRG